MFMEQLTQQALEFDKVKSYLARFTLSELGVEHVEAMAAVTDRQTIEAWLEEVSEIKEIRALQGHLPLENIHNIRELLSRSRVEGAILDPLELRQIYDILRSGRAVQTFITDIEPPIYQQIQGKVEKIVTIDVLERVIHRAIDEEGEILDGASQKLKRIRKDLRQAKEKIQSWLQSFLQRHDYQSVIQDQLITFRQNRYVVPIKASSRGKIKGIVHDQSASGVTVFIEPLETVELNNHIASLEAEEKQEILRILMELTDLVREHLFLIEGTMLVLGELDFINAKARLSEQWKCQPLKLHHKKCLKLLQARHPLLLIQSKKTQEKVVPIDVHLDEEYTTLLITGPNTGGKTVSLKTVGLLTLMVQAGMHIPVAKDSELCVFEKIFADIGDQQSIEQNLSTFSSHVSHIVNILNQVNERSLVLLDELGAGTDPAEGASLGVAILEYLDQMNATCMATTHHDALKAYAYTHPRTINACVEFDVNTLSPTYHLLIGIPGKSNAFIIAERLGLPPHLIQRGQNLMGEDLLKVDHLIRKLISDSEEVEQKKNEIDARYRGVLRLEKETDKLLAAAEKGKQEILDKALEEAKQIVDQAINQSQEVLRKLPASTRERGKQHVKELHREATEVRKKLKTHKKQQKNIPEPQQYETGELVEGRKVRIDGFDQLGTVLKLSKDAKQAEVQVGVMRVEMPVTRLRPIVLPKSKSFSQTVSVSEHSMGPSSDQVVPLELVLIGQRVDEALERINKYLDEAFLAGLSSVSIVHGMGTGKLRKAVSNFLRTHPHVVSYAIDEHNYGMTNVELGRK